jgi:F0F1-type ATP synthase assembly protein I
MPKELIGMVINPSKGKKKKEKKRSSQRKRSSTKKATRRTAIRSRAKGRNIVIIANPAHNQQALLELAAGTAVGLASGKLLDRYVFSKVHLPVPAGISVGDITTLAGGLFLLKKGGKGKEFATGVVAGAGAKIILNLVDSFLFHNKGIVSLHGEEEFPEYEIPYELGENPDLEGAPEVAEEELTEEPVLEPETVEAYQL